MATDSERGSFFVAEGATPLWNQYYRVVFTGRPFQRACINGPRYTLCASRPVPPAAQEAMRQLGYGQ